MATERTSSPGLARTISDQLLETVAAAFKSGTPSSEAAVGQQPPGGAASSSDAGGTLSRKSSRRLIPVSPGRGSASRNAHIRKSRSAQFNKVELDEVTSGAALSRASSASLGFSFSFTGFSMPPEDIADSKPFSDDDDIPEDLEAGTQRPKFQAEPTLPIYLKVMVLAMESP